METLRKTGQLSFLCKIGIEIKRKVEICVETGEINE